ncbi:primosomal protein N' family DNA-binding protein [Rathayibacter soli]|uniref:primosomal protein N' family DNA-binding protein n=1 Tax=Rathayibacter soli TaxID=3144168 RepID=UPI0027E4F207|nr:primosomal protein N' [Glaciibacter superstes]
MSALIMSAPHTGDRVARVLLDSPLPQLDRLLDYRIPEQWAADALPGVRVSVPLRSAGRIASGYLVELGDNAEYVGTLSELETVVSPARVLTPEVWALARRVSQRSAGGASDVIRLAIPPRQVRVEKAWLAKHPAHDVAHADRSQTAVRVEPARPAPIMGYPPGQLERALRSGERIAVRAIPRPAHLSDDVWIGHWALTLAQTAVHCLAAGRSAILIVPDYRDQEQLEAALRTMVPSDSIVRFDARQSNAERYRSFLDCLGSAAHIIIGNRSAVYAPAAQLGMIAIWDDGDPLHTEPLSPYVHVRDAALIRQEQQNCALMLIAHTRSVETQRLVEIGWLNAVGPDKLVTPRVIVTAQQASATPAASAARIPSTAWQAATTALADGPVLVQVSRPGYAPVVACRTCRQAARCIRCDGPLGVASAGAVPTCGACGAIAADWVCAHCAGTGLSVVSRGAGLTAEELGRAFPATRVIVADGQKPILAVGTQKALVVATRGAEPIAAGGYRAVLLLDGDRMLLRENLRVGDDCLRWWSNAAALAAPGAPVLLVGVAGPLARAMATWRQDGYASAELADRRQLKFPPAVRIASVTGRPETVAAAIAAIDTDSVIDTLGPAALEGGMVRSIVRFHYADGAQVAAQLRAAVIRNATARRKRPTGDARFRPAPTLRVRFDDPEVL